MDFIPSKCPCCNSDNWVTVNLESNKSGFSVGKAAVGAIAFGPLGIIAGGLGKKHTYITKVCKDCQYVQSYQIK